MKNQHSNYFATGGLVPPERCLIGGLVANRAPAGRARRGRVLPTVGVTGCKTVLRRHEVAGGPGSSNGPTVPTSMFTVESDKCCGKRVEPMSAAGGCAAGIDTPSADGSKYRGHRHWRNTRATSNQHVIHATAAGYRMRQFQDWSAVASAGLAQIDNRSGPLTTTSVV
jgi:hypothetical protein